MEEEFDAEMRGYQALSGIQPPHLDVMDS